ncbi:MAG: GlsB/YeaQ/YmgE family stress response membrane protein [Peptostreptococcaceae bacterium]|nr:GlsB/YeaQ/YmgE family stress response membrane protein [Peptostreptococcaceae bacterium]
MGVFSWIIFGALSGWIASMIAGKNKEMGGCANIVVGIIGAMIGGFVMNTLGSYGVTGFNIRSLGVAILGSWILLFILSKISGKK